jgi:hypothetical protein
MQLLNVKPNETLTASLSYTVSRTVRRAYCMSGHFDSIVAYNPTFRCSLHNDTDFYMRETNSFLLLHIAGKKDIERVLSYLRNRLAYGL